MAPPKRAVGGSSRRSNQAELSLGQLTEMANLGRVGPPLGAQAPSSRPGDGGPRIRSTPQKPATPSVARIANLSKLFDVAPTLSEIGVPNTATGKNVTFLVTNNTATNAEESLTDYPNQRGHFQTPGGQLVIQVTIRVRTGRNPMPALHPRALLCGLTSAEVDSFYNDDDADDISNVTSQVLSQPTSSFISKFSSGRTAVHASRSGRSHAHISSNYEIMGVIQENSSHFFEGLQVHYPSNPTLFLNRST